MTARPPDPMKREGVPVASALMDLALGVGMVLLASLAIMGLLGL